MLIDIIIGRLRDIGYSGWLCLLYFVPYVGLALWFVLFFIKGKGKDTHYGLVPKDYMLKDWSRVLHY